MIGVIGISATMMMMMLMRSINTALVHGIHLINALMCNTLIQNIHFLGPGHHIEYAGQEGLMWMVIGTYQINHN
jgi:hypothetical protein